MIPHYGALADVDGTALTIVLLVRPHLKKLALKGKRIGKDSSEMLFECLLLQDLLDEERIGIAGNDTGVALLL